MTCRGQEPEEGLPRVDREALQTWYEKVRAAGANADSNQPAPEDWHDEFYPVRIDFMIDVPRAGRYTLNLAEDELCDILTPYFYEPINQFTFAHDSLRAVVDGESVGGYRLFVSDQNLIRLGRFEGDPDRLTAAWRGMNPSVHKIEETEDIPGKVLSVSTDSYANLSLSQEVPLEPDTLYLLRYEAYVDSLNGSPSIGLSDPSRRYYKQLNHSYQFMSQSGFINRQQWANYQQLFTRSLSQNPYEPPVGGVEPGSAEVNINIHLAGQAKFADIRLQQVHWRIVLDLSETGRQTISLYYTPRGGAWYTVPDPTLFEPDRQIASLAPVSQPEVHLLPTNPHGFALDTDFAGVWTLPAMHPLVTEQLRKTRPVGPKRAIAVNMARGEDETVVAVVAPKRWGYTLLGVEHDLPVGLEVSTLEPIPIVEPIALVDADDTLIHHRSDAMVPIRYPYRLDNRVGSAAVLAFTLRAAPDTPTGKHTGDIRLVFRTPGMERESVDMPIELAVLPITLKPNKHFQMLFGGSYLISRLGKKDVPSFTADSEPLVEWHGIEMPEERLPFSSMASIVDIGRKNGPDDPIQDLVGRYTQRFLDFHFQLRTPTFGAGITFDVVRAADQEKPLLRNWDFSEYNRALAAFFENDRASSFVIHHTGHKWVDTLALSDTRYYSSERPKDFPIEDDWIELPESVFWELVGDYFEAFATNLDQHGWVDNAYVFVDESSRHEAFKKFSGAIRSRPTARRLRIMHSNQGSAAYTVRAEEDEPLMYSQIFDVLCPENDDHYNVLPSRWTDDSTPRPEHWVYIVNGDHMFLDTAGLSNQIMPMKLKQYGVNGFYKATTMAWSGPYRNLRPWYNPWVAARDRHGHGGRAFFYPPNPDGPSEEPDYTLVPSFRMVRYRDGIEDRALAEVIAAGHDDVGNSVARRVEEELAKIDRLWINPVQWYLNYPLYDRWQRQLRAAQE